MSSTTIDALQFALDGLTTQANVLANNISNVDTPGFTASNVSFQQSLQQALATGTPAAVSVSSSGAAPGLNGNNVNLSQELVAVETNAMHYQAVSNQITTHFQILSGSMGGQF
ncbi:MAG: flagellar basal body rod protein FlgB [Ferrimicrobium sp.]